MNNATTQNDALTGAQTMQDAQNLDQLAAFIETNDIDLGGRTDIPTFGTNVANVHGDSVYSWDDERVLIVDGQGVQLLDIDSEDAWWESKTTRAATDEFLDDNQRRLLKDAAAYYHSVTPSDANASAARELIEQIDDGELRLDDEAVCALSIRALDASKEVARAHARRGTPGARAALEAHIQLREVIREHRVKLLTCDGTGERG